MTVKVSTGEPGFNFFFFDFQHLPSNRNSGMTVIGSTGEPGFKEFFRFSKFT